MSKLTATQRNFPDIYQTLSVEQQDLLKMLSLIYESVSRTEMVLCLKRAGLRSHKGPFYTIPTLKPVLDVLEEQDLIFFDHKNVYGACRPEIVELATRQAMQDGSFAEMARVVKVEIQSKHAWQTTAYYRSYEQGIRDLRIAIYRGRDQVTIRVILTTIHSQFPGAYIKKHPYKIIFLSPADNQIFPLLPRDLVGSIIDDLFYDSISRLENLDDLHLILKEYCASVTNAAEAAFSNLFLQYVLRGEFPEAKKFINKWQEQNSHFIQQGFWEFIHNRPQEACTAYRLGLEQLHRSSRKKNICINSFEGLFYPLALLQTDGSPEIQEALAYLTMASKQKNLLFAQPINDILQTTYLAAGHKKKANKLAHSLEDDGYQTYISVFISYLTIFWQDQNLTSDKDVGYLIAVHNLAKDHGYFWLARESAALLVKFDIHTKISNKSLVYLNKKFPTPCLVNNIRRLEPWKQVLNSLINLREPQASSIQPDTRLVWLVASDFEFEHFGLSPKLQKMAKNGKWTKGRAVAMKTFFYKEESLHCLTSQDKQVIKTIHKIYTGGGGYYSYGSESFDFNLSKAFQALVGHPLLFRHDKPTVRLELVLGQPELHVKKISSGFKVSVKPIIDEELGYTLVNETPTRLKLVLLNDEYSRITEVLDAPIEIPEKAKEMVLDAVGVVAPMLTVHSDIGGAGENIKEVEADARLFVHLLPAGVGLRAEFFNKPFRDGGSFYHPGGGGKVVMTEIDSTQLQCRRDLDKERAAADKVIEQCPVLQRLEAVNYAYLIEEPEECLELLSDLQSLGEQVVIQWPQGEKLKVSTPLSAGQFSLRIKRDNEWFAVSGKLQVDDNMVIDMKKLLEFSQLADGRFVKLDDGKFLALTAQFKKRLDEIRSFSENFKNGVRLNPLAALALEDFTEEVGSFKSDKHWKNNIKRFTPVDPELPTTLQANLRDYQLEGFKWLACLSHWQVGACLADDMGLGKTVQALAAILLRAPKGPTLVLAPTSVMMNWQDEAERFAPTLNVHWFGSSNRQKMLDNLAEFDLVICSYGLLQVEGKKLAEVDWQTIVLDEAQAIKNMATKRSKAAMKLQANFRIITTGTPIENHLGELWNLFNFINPGLLGTIESFNQKFALPIEKFKNKQARNSLKKLIQPFILRRLKQDVLQELPSRTEITMQVEMSKDEAAMYEAQRSLALDKLADADNEKGGKQMQILAEITRLRRFCCNPSLVLPKAGIASSKLKVFGQIVDELLSNKHKALVFSQFVGHLALIKAHLQEKNISFQYLDGSTPVKQRQKRVNDFQAGIGDVFLISLKAGGSGLNLTAADYVIHMDPWWNPAVEDQASDRAHRIGQQRPVTVYRLVVKDTIEEKIVAMHKNKRDLADNLLGGSDMSGRISTNELLNLLKSS